MLLCLWVLVIWVMAGSLHSQLVKVLQAPQPVVILSYLQDL
jgi:hypothetical protein